MVEIGVLVEGGNDDSHIYISCNIASKKTLNLEPRKIYRDIDLRGIVNS
jgi:hypothetical protein